MDSKFFTSKARAKSYRYQKIVSILIFVLSAIIIFLGKIDYINFRYAYVGSAIFISTAVYLFFSKRIWITF